MAQGKTPMRFYLIGKQRSGKSLTGDMILGYNAFKKFHNNKSNATSNLQATANFDDRKITVIDALNENYDRGRLNEILKTNVERDLAENNTGCHTLLYVINYSSISDEDVEFLDDVKGSLGSKYVKQHIILLMTNSDTFKTESQNRFTFEEWCKRENGAFSKLMEACGNRIVLFDNMTDDDVKKKAQRDSLFAQVIEMALQRRCPAQATYKPYYLLAVGAFITIAFTCKNYVPLLEKFEISRLSEDNWLKVINFLAVAEPPKILHM